MPVKLLGGVRPESEVNKIIELAHGLPGSGKSAYALSGPPPFWYYNMDRFIGDLLAQLPPTTEVNYEAAYFDVDATNQATAKKYLAAFDVLVRDAIKADVDGSFVVDGWDIFWDVVKIALVPNAGEDAAPKQWAEANEYMNNHLRRLGLSKLNVCFTTISSQVWTGMKTETQRVKADGYKHKDRWLTHEVYLFVPEQSDQPDVQPKGGNPQVAGETGQSHRGYIAKSKLNEALIRRVIPNLSYRMLYRLTFGQDHPRVSELWTPGKKEAPVAS